MRRLVLLIGFILLLSGISMAGGPEGVSPSGSDVAVVGNVCPTFSWAGIGSAVSYRIEVYEAVTNEVQTHDSISSITRPVISKDVGTALSWTPSVGECLSDGKRYVWYVGVEGQDNGVEWSGGKVFEVNLLSDVEAVSAMKETVSSYLTNEWKKTDSYTQVKEEIKKELKEGGNLTAQGDIGIMGYEGNTNTLYGQGAGATISNGGAGPPDFNTFIGKNAGYNTTTGSYSWDGDYNTFVGYAAGYSNTTGNDNTFIGTGAGVSNTTGNSNTFIGLEAGFFNTTGSGNTFMGNWAGRNNTTGNDNTFIGRRAGYNTTGSGNVFLGYNAGYNETGSNKLYIDNSDTSSPLIYGEFDNDYLKVNGSFEVSGGLKFTGAGTPGAGKVLTSDASGNATWQTFTETGDITAVNAGTGLTGGGTTGDVTLSADTTYLQRRVSSTCAAGSSIRVINSDGTVVCETDDKGGYEGNTNTFYGQDAGQWTITNNGGAGPPDYNTFIGAGAGYNTQSGTNPWDGDYNTFIGYAAGFSNTTGYYNIFMGNYAGSSNTTGYSNTFIGSWAGNANTTGSDNIFMGNYAGSSNTTGNSNTFIGLEAGFYNTTGSDNTFMGLGAGRNNTTGNYNTFMGNYAGYYNTTGNGNVFLGYMAGYNETSSNKLYIANSDTSSPLIYGEFDSNYLRVNGMLNTAGHDITVNGSDNTGYRKPGLSTPEIGKMNVGWGGSGGSNIDLYSKGHATRPGSFYFIYGGGNFGDLRYVHYDGSTYNSRIVITKEGYMGLNQSLPQYPIHHVSGARLTVGGVWTNASSREEKENIQPLSVDKAFDALKGLEPVTFNYKSEKGETYVGFIAEDVPELVAMSDRKSLNPMDIVAVLTKVVKEQDERIKALEEENQQIKAENREIRAENKQIKDKLTTLEAENISIKQELQERIATLERQLKLMNSVASK